MARPHLMIASQHGFLEGAKLLLDHGATVNATSEIDGQTAVHAAVKKKDGKSLKVLLESRADPDVRDKYGQTPFDDRQPARLP
mmetsp:Transcript_47223/g.94676  ORF Transcript_47223/g.94676 Transcript_47223/m.94676 type:complete len:83 (+) Transcript_47223:52-300(+)